MGLRVYRDFVDDSRSRRHAHSGDPAFQGRTGGTGTGYQPVLIAEHHFGIGSHVYQNGGFLIFIYSRIENSGNQVAAEVAADIGENKDPGQGVHPDTQSPRLLLPAVC